MPRITSNYKNVLDQIALSKHRYTNLSQPNFIPKYKIWDLNQKLFFQKSPSFSCGWGDDGVNIMLIEKPYKKITIT